MERARQLIKSYALREGNKGGGSDPEAYRMFRYALDTLKPMGVDWNALAGGNVGLVGDYDWNWDFEGNPPRAIARVVREGDLYFWSEQGSARRNAARLPTFQEVLGQEGYELVGRWPMPKGRALTVWRR